MKPLGVAVGRAFFIGLGLAFAPAPAAGATPADDQHPRQLPTLNRMVRHFDFEEARHAPFDMPINFYRYGGEEGAAARGFPPFGTMRLTDEVASSGEWSFEFSLDGGSLAARVPTAVIPAVPLADYSVTARVRTEGLTYARARLVAWLHDKQGREIAASRTSSRLIDTGGAWITLSVDVRGDYEDASDLVLELQLLQPRQFAASSEEQLGRATLEDVTGRAWFDDVTVWHVPRVELSTNHPAQLIPRGAAPELSVLVRDLAHEELRARLQVYDIDGSLVYEEAFPAPRMPRPRSVPLPLDTCGWYRAVLEVTSAQGLVARRWLDFAVLPEMSSAQSSAMSRSPFGVVLASDWARSMHTLPELLTWSEMGTVILPLWSNQRGDSRPDEQQNRRIASHLHRLGVNLTVMLEQVPEQLARELDVPRDDVLGAMASDAALWRESVDDLVKIGADVRTWQIGPTGGAGGLFHVRLQENLDRVHAALAQFVSEPHVSLPMSADQHLPPGLRLQSRTIEVPYHVRPEAIEQYAEQWHRSESPVTAVLQLLPADDFDHRRRVEDAMFRGLHAWRAGLHCAVIDAPWKCTEQGELMPDVIFPAWRQLALQLEDRRFAGELLLSQGNRCWIVQGQEPGNDALVAWSDGPADTARIQMQLADVPVRVTDAFGNVRDVPLIGGEHDIQLGPTPVFIENINLPLVQFRGGFALDPPFIAAEHRAHRHHVVLRNPWDVSVSGTLHLLDKPQWRISPRSQDFVLPPGGELRLPVEIVFDRSVLAGRDRLEAEVLLQADGNYRLHMAADVTVGLHELDFTATWRIVANAETGRDDLLITQYITNTGNRVVYADAYLFAPQVRQERRLVAGLEPGEMVVRSFQIPDGAARLAGQSLRLSLADRNNLGRLNREIVIPTFVAQQQAGVSTE